MYNKQMRWKVKASFDGTACAFSSNCMKNYQYRRTAVEIIVEGWVIYFLRYSVYWLTWITVIKTEV